MLNDAMVKWHSDMAHLRDLLQQTGWDTYEEYVEKIIAESVEALIVDDQAGAQTSWRQGYIRGLRRALQLPQEVIKNMQFARDTING